MSLDALNEAGFTPDICAELIKAESDLKPQVDVTPDMDDEQSLKAAQAYDRHWWQYESVWRRLRDCLEARSLNRIRVSKDKKKLLTNWASIVSAIPVDEDGRVKVLTVLMSATMDRTMIEQFFHVDEWVEIDVQKHNNSVVRQANAPGSKAALLYGTGDREEEYGETNAMKKAAAENSERMLRGSWAMRTCLHSKALRNSVTQRRAGSTAWKASMNGAGRMRSFWVVRCPWSHCA